MESLARFFSSIVLFIFLAGVFVALAPNFFIKIGERKAGPKIATLESQVYQLQAQLAEAQQVQQEGQAIVQREQTLRRQADQRVEKLETLVRQKEKEAVAVARQLEDSTLQLASLREDLQGANETIQLVENRYAAEQEKVATLEEALLVKDMVVASRDEEIIKLTVQVEKTADAQRKVEAYQMLGLMLLLIGIITLTIRYRYRNKIAQRNKQPGLKMIFSNVQKTAS